MQSTEKTELVGFVELTVGSLSVQVPIRSARSENVGNTNLPLASFEAEGNRYTILIRGDRSSRAVENAVNEAAKEAVAHLSRKLLN